MYAIFISSEDTACSAHTTAGKVVAAACATGLGEELESNMMT
jgi:hypothetical protein